MTLTEKLIRLHRTLEKLVAMMKLDSTSQWTNKFIKDLDFCDSLLRKTPSHEDLVSLSKSITAVYQGIGSFNDYEPAIFDQKSGRYTPIPGTNGFRDLAGDVFNSAVDLRAKT